MATKHLCDRCDRAVGSPEEFMHLTLTNPPSMVTRQRVEAGKRVELCPNCAAAVQRFVTNAWERDIQVPGYYGTTKPVEKPGLFPGALLLVEAVYVEANPDPGRSMSRVEIAGYPRNTCVDVWNEKIIKVHDAPRKPEPAGEIENKEGKEENGRTENPVG